MQQQQQQQQVSTMNTTFQLCEKITNFPKIQEYDGIEIDSLESNGFQLQLQQQEEEKSNENLNNLCKNIVNCFMDEIVLPTESIQSISDLKSLNLRSNGIQNFPNSILHLTTLISLDLSDNNLLTLPPEISLLKNLQELILDDNLLSVLPDSLWELEFLKILKVANNRLALPPDKKANNMRAPILNDSEIKQENSTSTNGLTSLSLKGNRLKGNIILGNYGNLIELDVSENTIENLDLSAVEQLQVLQCSRNSLIHLTIHGRSLTTIIAKNNHLKKLASIQAPIGLKIFNVSYNELESLPEWLSGCSELETLVVNNNQLTALPNHLFCNEMPYLSVINLANNHLQSLPTIQRRLPVKALYLQNNSLSGLPDNFFKFVSNIRSLNVSNNRLNDLPLADTNLEIEKLFITANCLIDTSLNKIAPYLKNLKIFHASYNSFTSLPEDCATFWPQIEELVVSGNKLLKLPNQIGFLKNLVILRVHSNLLQNIPKLSNLVSLRILDLAHNQLDHIDLSNLIPPNLKFLDLSCNNKLHVDSQQFNTYRIQRPMSLVDVSGKNRTTLPLTPLPYCENDLIESNWSVGFSETAGRKPRLYISQIRLPAFCNTEGLFGMFDGESNNNIPLGVDKVVPRILLEERTVKETSSDYMKYTMLSSHRELKDKSQKQGLDAIICHIYKIKSTDYNFCSPLNRYVLKIATVGNIRIVLGCGSGPIKLLPLKPRTKQIQINPQFEMMVPDPDIADVYLDDHDEYMIIANKNLWDVISPESAIQEVTLQRNVILAAKRLQDLAQSYGIEDNLSIIVVKFNLIASDVDLLMRELRQTFKKSRFQDSICQSGCCCDTLINDCEKILIPPPMLLNDDRSSPSGQSEHCSDCNSSAKIFINQLNKHNNNNNNQDNKTSMKSITPSIFETIEIKANPERQSYRGVAKALRIRKEEEKNDSDSALSEEQFKCWEYMLEQNTQLLFDKELNTLTRGINRINPLKTSLSRSNPQISDTSNSPISFLSRQFGSARSFNPLLTKSNSRFVLDKKLGGGPHAAYFGSLQRLMPYNLEYDFAVMHERGLADSLDLDRMQQYWGVTTTEL